MLIKSYQCLRWAPLDYINGNIGVEHVNIRKLPVQIAPGEHALP